MIKIVVGIVATMFLLAPALLALVGRARVRPCCPADPALDRRMAGARETNPDG